jgi:hypothetical protein
LKTLNESFTDQEFAEVQKVKNEYFDNWHDAIMFLSHPDAVDALKILQSERRERAEYEKVKTE